MLRQGFLIGLLLEQDSKVAVFLRYLELNRIAVLVVLNLYYLDFFLWILDRGLRLIRGYYKDSDLT